MEYFGGFGTEFRHGFGTVSARFRHGGALFDRFWDRFVSEPVYFIVKT